MTREEAIEVLKEIYNYTRFDTHATNEARTMAIKALEQTRWIPISERLPKEDGDYLVTTRWKGSYSGNVYTEIHMAEYKKNRKKSKKWDCDDEVIAWMPLPEPYSESEEVRADVLSLESAIKHCEEVAEKKEYIAETVEGFDEYTREECLECASEHRQLAEWLKRLKRIEDYIADGKDDMECTYSLCFWEIEAVMDGEI